MHLLRNYPQFPHTDLSSPQRLGEHLQTSLLLDHPSTEACWQHMHRQLVTVAIFAYNSLIPHHCMLVDHNIPSMLISPRAGKLFGLGTCHLGVNWSFLGVLKQAIWYQITI